MNRTALGITFGLLSGLSLSLGGPIVRFISENTDSWQFLTWRSWSFAMHQGEPMYHHLDRWEPDWILALLLGRDVKPPHDTWPARILGSLDEIRDPRIAGVVLIAPHFFTEPCGLASIAAAREAFDRGDLRRRLALYHGANVDEILAGLPERIHAELGPGHKKEQEMREFGKRYGD